MEPTEEVSLSGKAAFVTGGSNGIGKAVAKALLDENIKVFFVDINESEGANTLKELRAKHGGQNVHFAKCDVTSESQLERTIVQAKKTFGHLDILVNNAGILGEVNWQKTVDVNLGGVIKGTLLAIKHLENKNGGKGGTVINTASIAGLHNAPFLPAYCATKHAVVGWTRSMGHLSNVAKTNVKVNAVCPGVTTTEILKQFAKDPDASTDFDIVKAFGEKQFESFTMSAEEVAQGYVKILKENVTGATLLVAQPKGTLYVAESRL